MSIGKRIHEALKKLDDKDIEGALIPICIAIAATSAKEYPQLKTDAEKYKAFLSSNVDIITFAGMGINMKAGFTFKFTDPSIKHPLVNGQATWDEVLYHSVRCRLIHEAELDGKVTFKEGNTIAHLGDKLLLPTELLHGVIFAIIGSINNVTERLEISFSCNFGMQSVDLNSLWGNKAKIMALLEQAGPKSARADMPR